MWDDHGSRYEMMNGGGAMMGFGVLVLVLLALALVAVVVVHYLHLNPRHAGMGAAPLPAGTAEPEARRLLDRRLALGEITTEEYASVRSALEA